MSLDFHAFNVGTLFLVRTPDVFPEGYAEKCFADMKNNLHFDFAALLETWNCEDGVLWKTDKFPRSSYWKDEKRDPLEECFLAADRHGMAFLPEAGMMDRAFMYAHKDGMYTRFDGKISRYGRIGLSPSCPHTLSYLKEKYDTLLQKFSHHPSCKGVCLPAENTIAVTYDRYTREAYLKQFGEEMPSPETMYADKKTEQKVHQFLEDQFLQMYRALASYIKEKYALPLMHYPIDAISAASFFHPATVLNARNISVMTRARELDLLNLQLHPPLYPNPYFFKLETEYLMANSDGIACMADTHFYHECSAGRVPDMTPKRNIDAVLSTLTPNGISFFCYGFMAEELPLWKKQLNPGAPVYKVYSEPHTLSARREMCLKVMDFVEILRPMIEGTVHSSDLAIYFPEELNNDYRYSSYCTEHLFGLHELLNAAAIPTRILARIPESPEEQKALILDCVKSISEEDAQKLRIYLEKGGKLFILGNCCREIESIAGLHTELSDATFVVHEKSRQYHHSYFRIPTDGKHFTERNGEPMLRYDTKDPVVTRSGNVIYFGASDAVGRYGAYRDQYLAEYWKTLLTEEGLNSGVEFHNVYANRKDAHQFTSCDLFKNDSKMLLLIRNFGVEHDHSSVTWRLPEDMQVEKAYFDGQEFVFENGAELPLWEHFVAIFAERKRNDVR